MDLAVYMVAATFVVFFTGAAVALLWSLADGQWHDLPRAARIVFEDDDPYPGECSDQTQNGA